MLRPLSAEAHIGGCGIDIALAALVKDVGINMEQIGSVCARRCHPFFGAHVVDRFKR
jgi:hypothetical protein